MYMVSWAWLYLHIEDTYPLPYPNLSLTHTHTCTHTYTHTLAHTHMHTHIHTHTRTHTHTHTHTHMHAHTHIHTHTHTERTLIIPLHSFQDEDLRMIKKVSTDYQSLRWILKGGGGVSTWMHRGTEFFALSSSYLGGVPFVSTLAWSYWSKSEKILNNLFYILWTAHAAPYIYLSHSPWA